MDGSSTHRPAPGGRLWHDLIRFAIGVALFAALAFFTIWGNSAEQFRPSVVVMETSR